MTIVEDVSIYNHSNITNGIFEMRRKISMFILESVSSWSLAAFVLSYVCDLSLNTLSKTSSIHSCLIEQSLYEHKTKYKIT